MDPVSFSQSVNLEYLNVIENVQREIDSMLPPDFADLVIRVEQAAFRVHSVMIKQKPGMLQILTRDWAWNKNLNLIELKTYQSIEIAGVLLILYGLKNSPLFQRVKTLSNTNIFEIWDLLYPGASPDDVNVKKAFKTSDCVGTDFAFKSTIDDSICFGHQAFLASKSAKLHRIFKAYLPKNNFVYIPVSNLNRRQIRAIFEYLYEERYPLSLKVKNLKGLIDYADQYIDDPKDFIMSAFEKIFKALDYQSNSSLIELIELTKKQNYFPIQQTIGRITKSIIKKNPLRKPLSISEQKSLGHLDLRHILNTPREVEQVISFLEQFRYIRSIDLRGTSVQNGHLDKLVNQLGIENAVVDESCLNLSKEIVILFSAGNAQDKLQRVLQTPILLTDFMIKKIFSMINSLEKVDKSKFKHMVSTFFKMNQKMISDEGLALIGVNMGERVQELSLLQNHLITKEGIKIISKLFPNLKTLILCIFQEKGEFNLSDMIILNHLPELRKLQHLTLASHPAHDLHIVVDLVKKMPSLKDITLKTIPLSEDPVRLNPLFSLNIPVYLYL